MVGTHIETHTKVEGRRQQAELYPRRSSFSLPPSAFTLTELLVVITIIAILAGLITGAAVNALKRAKQAAITLEMQNIGSAMEDLKTEFGAYPPNGMINGVAAIDNLAQSDFERMFKKAFPRSQEHRNLIRALAGDSENQPVLSSDLFETGMTGDEAIFFWLGGFSKDPSYPISGPGGPSFVFVSGGNSNEILEDRNLRYEFDLGRLEPRNADGVFDESNSNGRYITYEDPRDDTIVRRINFWRYNAQSSQTPIVYFDTSRHSPAEYDLPIMTAQDGGEVYALKQLRAGIAAAQNNADVKFVEDQKFQILHAGIDDLWGNMLSFHLDPNDSDRDYDNVILAPEGPFIGEVADTLGNFMTGPLEDKQE